jgi:hypothetical protein
MNCTLCDTHVFIYTLKTIEYIEKTYSLTVEKITGSLITTKKTACKTGL